MLKEFRDFAMRGNVVDMAVGIIVGAAFGTVVKSLVSDIMMPPFGRVLGQVDFSKLRIPLGHNVSINYGAFLNSVISFLLVSFAVFLLVRQMNRFRRQQEQAPTTKECPYCFSSIPVRALRCAHCTSDLAAPQPPSLRPGER